MITATTPPLIYIRIYFTDIQQKLNLSPIFKTSLKIKSRKSNKTRLYNDQKKKVKKTSNDLQIKTLTLQWPKETSQKDKQWPTN